MPPSSSPIGVTSSFRSSTMSSSASSTTSSSSSELFNLSSLLETIDCSPDDRMTGLIEQELTFKLQKTLGDALGSLADSELYNDLASAFVRCRLRHSGAGNVGDSHSHSSLRSDHANGRFHADDTNGTCGDDANGIGSDIHTNFRSVEDEDSLEDVLEHGNRNNGISDVNINVNGVHESEEQHHSNISFNNSSRRDAFDGDDGADYDSEMENINAATSSTTQKMGGMDLNCSDDMNPSDPSINTAAATMDKTTLPNNLLRQFELLGTTNAKTVKNDSDEPVIHDATIRGSNVTNMESTPLMPPTPPQTTRPDISIASQAEEGEVKQQELPEVTDRAENMMNRLKHTIMSNTLSPRARTSNRTGSVGATSYTNRAPRTRPPTPDSISRNVPLPTSKPENSTESSSPSLNKASTLDRKSTIVGRFSSTTNTATATTDAIPPHVPAPQEHQRQPSERGRTKKRWEGTRAPTPEKRRVSSINSRDRSPSIPDLQRRQQQKQQEHHEHAEDEEQQQHRNGHVQQQQQPPPPQFVQSLPPKQRDSPYFDTRGGSLRGDSGNNFNKSNNENSSNMNINNSFSSSSPEKRTAFIPPLETKISDNCDGNLTATNPSRDNVNGSKATSSAEVMNSPKSPWWVLPPDSPDSAGLSPVTDDRQNCNGAENYVNTPQPENENKENKGLTSTATAETKFKSTNHSDAFDGSFSPNKQQTIFSSFTLSDDSSNKNDSHDAAAESGTKSTTSSNMPTARPKFQIGTTSAGTKSGSMPTAVPQFQIGTTSAGTKSASTNNNPHSNMKKTKGRKNTSQMHTAVPPSFMNSKESIRTDYPKEDKSGLLPSQQPFGNNNQQSFTTAPATTNFGNKTDDAMPPLSNVSSTPGVPPFFNSTTSTPGITTTVDGGFKVDLKSNKQKSGPGSIKSRRGVIKHTQLSPSDASPTGGKQQQQQQRAATMPVNAVSYPNINFTSCTPKNISTSTGNSNSAEDGPDDEIMMDITMESSSPSPSPHISNVRDFPFVVTVTDKGGTVGGGVHPAAAMAATQAGNNAPGENVRFSVGIGTSRSGRKETTTPRRNSRVSMTKVKNCQVKGTAGIAPVNDHINSSGTSKAAAAPKHFFPGDGCTRNSITTPSPENPPIIDSNDKNTSTLFGEDNSFPKNSQYPENQPRPVPNETTVPSAQEKAPPKDAFRQRLERVIPIREEARNFYIKKKYQESIRKYTEAIRIHTNDFNDFPNSTKDLENSEILATLYGNRAAGLIMIGAYNAATDNCDKALSYLKDYNPLAISKAGEQELISILKADSGLTLMTKLLARKGRSLIKSGEVDPANKTFDRAIHVAQSALVCHHKVKAAALSRGIHLSSQDQQLSERVLNQCITDSTLNRAEAKRLKEATDTIKRYEGEASNKNYDILKKLNEALSLSPGSIFLQEKMVFHLVKMRKWTEVALYCEKLACKNVDLDGVFTEDLKECNPFPSVPLAVHLRSNTFADNEDSNHVLNTKEVSEAVLRLPYSIVPHYIRALRLEERYVEAGRAGSILLSYSEEAASLTSPLRQRHKSRYYWLPAERDKVRRTMTGKDRGDTHYRNGEYNRAAEKYASVLKIDSEGDNSRNVNDDPWNMETVGGRLHAVLHCNRAACLMAMRKFNEAAKECTAALNIEGEYMKALLRRARCYARLERFDESIAQYKRWTALVIEARNKAPSRSDNECSFDRASDISEADFQKSNNELSEVKSLKEVARQKSQAEANARSERQKYYQETFRQASANARGTYKSGEWEGDNFDGRQQDAYERRQQWYDQKGTAGSRRWDSFGGTSPKKRGGNSRSPKMNSPKRSSSYTGQGHASYTSSDRSQWNQESQKSVVDSPGSSNVTCHYEVLQTSRTASQAEIKKAYHKMALKYHPDKNPSSSAAEVFRKVKLAYETLSKPHERRKYDAQLRFRSY